MTDEALTASATVTLDGTGAGKAQLGPGRQRETWAVTRYTTSGASATEPRLDVFRGASALIDTTNHGNQDVSDATTPIPLYGGEFLTASYTGGTAGARMTFYLEGTRNFG